MMPRRILASLSFVVLAGAGCADRLAAPVASPGPGSIAVLEGGGPAAAPRTRGSTVVFTARLDPGASETRAAAFAAHIEYDPSVITYVGPGDATSGLVAAHDTAGVLRVAGASVQGYADGVLFRAVFRVARSSPAAASELRLVIDELRDVHLGNPLPAAVEARSARLRPWR